MPSGSNRPQQPLELDFSIRGLQKSLGTAVPEVEAKNDIAKRDLDRCRTASMAEVDDLPHGKAALLGERRLEEAKA